MNHFLHLEQQLTAHIRNPESVAAPAGMEPRRAKIYCDLFYNNIEGFISSGFPVLRNLMDDQCWQAMVRDFMIHHQCHSPYFLEISQEFLLYLQHSREAQPDDFPFMLELAHYEWVELALDIADINLSDIAVDCDGDVLEQLPVVSPLAWSLLYQFPVHRIGPDYIPQQAPGQPSYLIVYRNTNDKVEFMQANAVTARLLELLQQRDAGSTKQVLHQLATEMDHPQPHQVLDSGLLLIKKLRSLDIILGTRQ